MPTSEYAHISNALREQIVMTPPGEQLHLYEAKLAEEFGVSRTPIRQVLHHLASQHQLETRAGVGTVSVMLEDGQKAAHIKTYAEITRAAANAVEGRKIPQQAQMDMMGIQNLLALRSETSKKDFVGMNARIIRTMGTIVPDPLLSDAMMSAHWRLLRWRVADYDGHSTAMWSRFHTNLGRAVSAVQTGDSAQMLRTAAQLGEGYIGEEMSQDDEATTNVLPLDGGNRPS